MGEKSHIYIENECIPLLWKILPSKHSLQIQIYHCKIKSLLAFQNLKILSSESIFFPIIWLCIKTPHLIKNEGKEAHIESFSLLLCSPAQGFCLLNQLLVPAAAWLRICLLLTRIWKATLAKQSTFTSWAVGMTV